MASIPASPPLVAGFDAKEWIAEWSAHGGIVILVDDRLYLRRQPNLPYPLSSHLDRLSIILIRCGGGQAVAEHLAQRREGVIP
ncbi:hypothetical protein [Sphingomonas montanisoli]|uniref:Uncharacterized protein n=1 Tax=Sphingomonas montanisoli TaxID=2606412 RepID=A0A5D9C2R8_9SPHN|nr:hypothetical protein [Sphingomonas montanisoli]TZG25876.1 hypothetical protein FYJ91_12920 [Sphingomonas montanisoli]